MAGVPWFSTLFGATASHGAVDIAFHQNAKVPCARWRGCKARPAMRRRRASPAKSSTRCAAAMMARRARYPSPLLERRLTPLFLWLYGAASNRPAISISQRAVAQRRTRHQWIERWAIRRVTGTSNTAAHSRGLANQGWKDSDDRSFIRRAPARPRSRSRNQGYVYAAGICVARSRASAVMFRKRIDWRMRPRPLKRTFERDFWLEARRHDRAGAGCRRKHAA